MVTVEFEAPNGATIGAVRFKVMGNEEDIEIKESMGDVDIADVDGDYIFDSDDVLVRVQIVGNIDIIDGLIKPNPNLMEILLKRIEEESWINDYNGDD